MAEPLSTAASAFAIVGVADVVLRATVECHRFLSGIKDAPAEIKELQACLQENKQLFKALIKHLEDLRDLTSSISAFARESSSALDGLTSAIRALDRELKALQISIKKYNGHDKTWARVKWVLDNRKISKSVEKLERSKSTLSVFLALVEGKRSAFDIKRAEDAAQQTFQRTTSALNNQTQQELLKIEASQNKLLSGQERVIFQSAQQAKRTNLLQKSLVKANEARQIELRKHVTVGNRKVIDAISSKLKRLELAVPKAPRAATKSNRKISFYGWHQDTILMPLLLMRDQLQQAVLQVIPRHTNQVSAQQLYWLQTEFENLVASATQEVAASYRGSTAVPFDHWTSNTREDTFCDTVESASNSSTSTTSQEPKDGAKSVTVGPYRTKHQRKLRSRYSHCHTFEFEFPAGQLQINVPYTKKKAVALQQANEAYIKFVPSKGICSTPIRASFYETVNHGLEPRLYIQLNAFRKIQDINTCIYYDLFAEGSLAEIDAAFRSGTISPYDQSEAGVTLSLWTASWRGRKDVLQYLDSQGIGQSNLNGALDVIEGSWAGIADELWSDDDVYGMLQFLNDNDVMFGWSSQMSALYGDVSFDGGKTYSDRHKRLLSTWVEFLIQNGYELETQNKDGRTPLLDQSFRTGAGSLTLILMLILEFGANPHASDSRGFNAISYAMLTSNLEEPEGPKALEFKLFFLLEAGIDPSHRDNLGRTLSVFARLKCKCWTEWCGALEQHGILIEDLLRKEDNLWLLEEIGNEEDIDEESQLSITPAQKKAIQ